jgi:hypothetical protein
VPISIEARRRRAQACLSTFSPVPGAVDDCVGRAVFGPCSLLFAAAGVRVGAGVVVGCAATCGDETGVTPMSMVLVLEHMSGSAFVIAR